MNDSFHFLSLIGLRGAGKTTVARELATILGWNWNDADQEVERRAGRSIAEIFSTEGEDAFREIEAEILASLVSRNKCVLATGGGAVLRESNRALLRNAGPVIWLTCDLATMLARIESDAASRLRRPLLAGSHRAAEIELLMKSREPLYSECATLSVDSAGKSPAAIAREIVDRLYAARQGAVS